MKSNILKLSQQSLNKISNQNINNKNYKMKCSNKINFSRFKKTLLKNAYKF